MWDRPLVRITGLMAGTTVGAGLFALPYVASRAGWVVGLVYLLLLARVVQFAQGLYLKSLHAEGGRRLLLGMVAERFGFFGRGLALIIVTGGLVLTLVAYLVLAYSFFSLIFPNGGFQGAFWFWFVASLLVVLGARRVAAAESLGFLAMTGIVAGIFLGNLGELPAGVPMADWGFLLLPFGPVVFSLAAWPAVEPAYEMGKKGGLSLKEVKGAMDRGTALAALVYILFVFGILSSAETVTPDTLTGLTNWAPWARGALAVLGLVAIWTSYVPIGLAVRNSLHRDLGWTEGKSALLVFFLPPFLLWLGLNDFLGVVALVGGVFLALGYAAILLVSRRIVNPSIWESFWIRAVLLLFLLAAAYEVWYFLAR